MLPPTTHPCLSTDVCLKSVIVDGVPRKRRAVILAALRMRRANLFKCNASQCPTKNDNRSKALAGNNDNNERISRVPFHVKHIQSL